MKLRFYSNYAENQRPVLSVVVNLFNAIHGKKVAKYMTRSKHIMRSGQCSVFIHPKFVQQFANFSKKITKWDIQNSFQFKDEFLNSLK